MTCALFQPRWNLSRPSPTAPFCDCSLLPHQPNLLARLSKPQSCKSFPCARLSAIKTDCPQFEERLNRRKSMFEARMAQQASPCNEQRARWPRHVSNDSVAFGPAAHLERINKALEDPELPAQRREKLLSKKAWIEQTPEEFYSRSCPFCRCS